jgi:Glycosyl transferases group 1
MRGARANSRPNAARRRSKSTAPRLHVPRAPCARALAGIPTIRMFEALACGIPLVSAPWSDTEGLFRAGVDHLTATSAAGMIAQLDAVLHERGLAESLAAAGLQTIASRHTCDHRVDELMRIVASLRGRAAREVVAGWLAHTPAPIRHGAYADPAWDLPYSQVRARLRILKPVPQERVADELQTAVHPQLPHPVRLVHFHGLHAQSEP